MLLQRIADAKNGIFNLQERRTRLEMEPFFTQTLKADNKDQMRPLHSLGTIGSSATQMKSYQHEGVAIDASLVKSASRPVSNEKLNELRERQIQQTVNSIKTAIPKKLPRSGICLDSHERQSPIWPQRTCMMAQKELALPQLTKTKWIVGTSRRP